MTLQLSCGDVNEEVGQQKKNLQIEEQNIENHHQSSDILKRLSLK